jgi:hypothetical protein
MTGKKDPMFAARVQAETENITEEIERKHGVLNIAVDLIRQARDEVCGAFGIRRLPISVGRSENQAMGRMPVEKGD